MVESASRSSREHARAAGPRVREGARRAGGRPEDRARDGPRAGRAARERAAAQGLGHDHGVLLEEELGAADAAAAFALGGPGGVRRARCSSSAPTEQARAAARGLRRATAATSASARSRGARPKPNKERAGFSTIAEPRPTTAGCSPARRRSSSTPQRADRFVVFAQVDPDAGLGRPRRVRRRQGRPGLEGRRATRHARPRRGELRRDRARRRAGRRAARSAASAGERLHAGDAALLREARARGRGARRSASRASRSTSRASTATRARRSASRSATSRRSPSRSPIARWTSTRARWLVWRAAHAWDARRCAATQGARSLAHARRRVAFALEAAMRCADDGVQLHGGAGFMRDFLAEKLMRDAKQLALCW